jgi:membrane protein implicated in regulation of membrane protease activity
MIMLPIPPVIAWAVGAVGAVVMSKLLAREWRRVNEELDARERDQQRAAKVRVEDRGTLRRDPVTGVYRPG